MDVCGMQPKDEPSTVNAKCLPASMFVETVFYLSTENGSSLIFILKRLNVATGLW